MPALDCECVNWATDCLVAGHHYRCPKFDVKPLVSLIHDLCEGMELWAHDEDGIHSEAWEAYKAACEMTYRTYNAEPA